MTRHAPYLIRAKWWTPPFGRNLAVTLYPWIFLRAGWTATTCRHELVHVAQIRRAGWLRFYASWLFEWVMWGYEDISWEIEAHANASNAAYLSPELEALVRADT